MGGKAWTEAKRVRDVLVGILSVMTLCQRGEIGDARVQCGSGRAAAFGVRAVAGRAILLEHAFARGNVSRGKLVSLDDGIILGSQRADGRKQSANKERFARGHDVLPNRGINVAWER